MRVRVRVRVRACVRGVCSFSINSA